MGTCAEEDKPELATVANKVPLHLAVWACVLVVLSPKRFSEFQARSVAPLGIPASTDNKSVEIVARAFWISLVLVLLSGAFGAMAGTLAGSLYGLAPVRIIMWLQITGASFLLWGTLFVRGWEIQVWEGETLIERVNQWIYRTLYCLGSAIIVASLTWPQG